MTMENKCLFTSEQFRAADRFAAAEMGLPTVALMERAADGLFAGCKILCGEEFEKIPVTFLCGKGNNGGDGFCLCARLAEQGYDVKAVSVFPTESLGSDCREMAVRLPDGALISFSEESGKDEAFTRISASCLIVDCVFGTGFSGSLPESVISLFGAARGKKVLACDLPSGVFCDCGRVADGALKADLTVTFATEKPAMYLYPGKEYCGCCTVWDIGIDEALSAQKSRIFVLSEKVISSLLVSRPENSHKGTFGTVQLCCGSKRMTGAAVLSAKAALRSGVGLVVCACKKKVRRVLQQTLFEPVFCKPKAKTRADAFVVGCGLGKKGKYLKKYIKRRRPVVIDGDGLNYLAEHQKVLKKHRSPVVLTPHPLEAARLLGKTVLEVESDRIGAALALSQQFSAVAVLKGRHTLIAFPDGTVWVNPGGNSALAKGGSGDVLAGFLGGLIASGYSPENAALIAVYAHSFAAEILTESRPEESVLPSEILGTLENVFLLKR